jgi:hypothetical protein
MLRRELLRAAAASAALALLPREAQAIWSRVAHPEFALRQSVFTTVQRQTLSALADGIIPRTDTPSATEVGVLAWIDVIMMDYYNDTERAALRTGLDAIDAMAREQHAAGFAALDDTTRTLVMTALEASDRTSPAGAAYRRVKGLVVHGYFTSEPVQKTVLKTQIMPGRFEGDAPFVVPGRGGRND